MSMTYLSLKTGQRIPFWGRVSVGFPVELLHKIKIDKVYLIYKIYSALNFQKELGCEVLYYTPISHFFANWGHGNSPMLIHFFVALYIHHSEEVLFLFLQPRIKLMLWLNRFWTEPGAPSSLPTSFHDPLADMILSTTKVFHPRVRSVSDIDAEVLARVKSPGGRWEDRDPSPGILSSDTPIWVNGSLCLRGRPVRLMLGRWNPAREDDLLFLIPGCRGTVLSISRTRSFIY